MTTRMAMTMGMTKMTTMTADRPTTPEDTMPDDNYQNLSTQELMSLIDNTARKLHHLNLELNSRSKCERQDVTQKCLSLKKQGYLIKAIKIYRAEFGCGLKEAHDIVTSESFGSI